MTENTREELTDKEERYAQLRAQGYTKTDAHRLAYPDAQPHCAGPSAAQVERREIVLKRIQQLREEQNEVYGLDVKEQIRRYNQLYMMALEKGQLGLAKQMLERIDAIGGFDAPNRSVVTKITKGESFKDTDNNVKKDLEKFTRILNPSDTPEGTQPEDNTTIN